MQKNHNIKYSSKVIESYRKSKSRVTVRFSDEEYLKILKEAQEKNKSIPQLLKLCYETVEGNPVEVPINELKDLYMQLVRIGNNVNTALRKINAGEYHMLEDIKDSLESSATNIKFMKSKVQKVL